MDPQGEVRSNPTGHGHPNDTSVLCPREGSGSGQGYDYLQGQGVIPPVCEGQTTSLGYQSLRTGRQCFGVPAFPGDLLWPRDAAYCPSRPQPHHSCSPDSYTATLPSRVRPLHCFSFCYLPKAVSSTLTTKLRYTFYF